MRKFLFIVALLLTSFILASCAEETAEEEAQEETQTIEGAPSEVPEQPPEPELIGDVSPCGDGVCDETETGSENPCPEDCGE